MSSSDDNLINMKYSYIVHDADNNTFKSILHKKKYNTLNEKTEELEKFSDPKFTAQKLKFMNNSQYENLNNLNPNSSIVQLNTDDKEYNCETNRKKSTRRLYDHHQYTNKNSNARKRLEQKNKLLETRLSISNWATFFGLLGFILMIFECEFVMNQVYIKVNFKGFYKLNYKFIATFYLIIKDSLYSLIIKSLITSSTIPLVILVIVYNSIQVKVKHIF